MVTLLAQVFSVEVLLSLRTAEIFRDTCWCLDFVTPKLAWKTAEDRFALFSLQNPASYLGLAWQADQLAEPSGGNQPFSRSGREAVWMHTLLCSTKLTQNGQFNNGELAERCVRQE